VDGHLGFCKMQRLDLEFSWQIPGYPSLVFLPFLFASFFAAITPS